MESRNKKKCVICNKRACGESKLFLATFPLDSQRCRKWVKNAGIEDLAYIPIEKLHKRRYICGEHFTPESFNLRGTRLKKNAIPTLKLCNPALPDAVLTGFPLHSKDSNKENLKSVLIDHSYCGQKKFGKVPLSDANIVQTQTTLQEAIDIKSIDIGTKMLKNWIPIPSTSSAPDHETYATITVSDHNMVHQQTKEPTEITVTSYKRSKKSAALQEAKPLFTNREKKLFKRLQNAKKDIRKLAKSRYNLDNLQSEMLTSIVTGVLKNQKKKPHGKRWSLENKIYALAIFKRSPKAYRYMQKLLTLPSIKTLQRILKDVPMEPGLNPTILDILKKRAVKMSQDNKYCSLLFDEMALKKRLIYNEITDKIEGFVDFGPGENMGREKKYADHAIVFMVQGLKFKYKQYIGHYFVEGTISTLKLSRIIIEIIKKLREIGFTVLTTVCDQGSTNIGALNLLKKK